MIYCVSDLHGELARFQAMLELIRFSAADHLYVIGDVVDRGPNGIDLLDRIRTTANMTMLLGNHEYMCLATFEGLDVHGAGDHWKKRCGGDITYRQLTELRTDAERVEILQFLATLPDDLDIIAGGRSFHLVHGLPAEDRYHKVWGRPTVEMPRFFPDQTVIVGHTPTPYVTNDFEHPFSIWYGDGIIDIDCGCGEDSPFKRLGCLRLDDMAEFYL